MNDYEFARPDGWIDMLWMWLRGWRYTGLDGGYWRRMRVE
jgi:hypothetical protein